MKVKLKTLTPIFIGAGKEKVLSPRFDWVMGKEGVLLIDQNRLFEILTLNERLVDDYVKHVKEGGNIRNFIDNLDKERVIGKEDVKSLIKGKLRFKVALKDKENIEIQRFISSPLGNYIPGSSIKGAIRTALGYYYFNKKKQRSNTLNVLDKIKNVKNPKFAYSDANLQFETFSARFSSYGKYDAKDDFLKLLRVRDSAFLSRDNFVIFQCSVFNFNSNKEGAPVFLECLDEGKEVEIEINFFKGKSPIYNLCSGFWSFLKEGEEKAILKIFEFLNGFALDFIKREKNFFKNRQKDLIDFYNKIEKEVSEKTALLLLGRGTTFFGKTIDMAFTDEEFERLRDIFPIRQMGVVGGKKSKPFPITRLLCKDGSGYKPLGWALLTIK
ncbi:MAG: type III-A CRISPR-associated RAMP protein Csm5 [Synergistetes bacterium]|nr:type III-A CRISPR-associated RAMP protein Csm5 [Synergistota bacterium]MCX8127335.1 type III-A CRISPR-associated RAMP protein Csm5 [Synergistota bacterium]MDW8192199.1 type III-A CRISPR-associated RAMP protein Csm5 [Synergistota bacterium]